MLDKTIISQSPPEGRRARKRRETRARIVEAAMNLLLERGYSGVTIDEIAEAADISKRSFFDYFPSKDHVVEGWHEAFGEALVAAIETRPRDEPPTRVIERAMISAIGAVTTEQSIAIGRLVQSTPALAARSQVKYGMMEERIADALFRRQEESGDALVPRLIAILVTGLLRATSEQMQLADKLTKADVKAYTAAMFEQLWRSLKAIAAMA